MRSQCDEYPAISFFADTSDVQAEYGCSVHEYYMGEYHAPHNQYVLDTVKEHFIAGVFYCKFVKLDLL